MHNKFLFLISLCISLPACGMFRDYGTEKILEKAKVEIQNNNTKSAMTLLEWVSLKDSDLIRKTAAYYYRGNIAVQKKIKL